jgi:nucleoid-associated protein YgaU
MGRETKILLGLLGLLAGVFVGVLSMKLLVPRPPAGAGPDVHADAAVAEPHDLVAPPDLAALAPPPAEDAALAPEPYAGRASRFASAPRPDEAETVVAPAASAAPPHHDPFVARTSLEAPSDAPAREPDAALPIAPPDRPLEVHASPGLMPPAASVPAPPGSAYVTQAGDSWWSLAERAYGDGRLYRALFAWNRALEPRVSLVPGTPLEIPPLDRLRMAWPALTPKP